MSAPWRRRLRASGLDAPRKAWRIYRDYVQRWYFPLHGLTVSQRVRCAPLLLLVEVLVYQVDAVSEGAKDVDLDVVRNDDYAKLHRYKAAFEALLRRAHAYNDAVARQLQMGEQYVRLENKVTATRTAAREDVLRLAELRPSDVRLLHAMIFALLRQPADEELLDLAWPVEVLADIGNDLRHYHDDVASGRYNTYAAFVALYGADAPARMRAEIQRYEEAFRSRLHRVPMPRRAAVEQLCLRRYARDVASLPEIVRS
ncbi:hypothetical protein AB0H83_36995 [Dactylosporangium sp. NPDC050688]|uniref:hypothetical protein n=1 Tax=Dactylosporangium sp. NPDC050688 TaxID=3157217 RepID=UPI0033D4B13F